MVWGLGEHGNFTLFDQKGNQRQNLFYHAHALEKVDNNTFIIFDNDFLNQTNSNNHRSQILEITINETTMTANTSWVWTGTGEYYSAYWGDADRLPNGNRFGAFGTQSHDGTDIGPRLVEVNESGHIVWELYYKGGSLGIYQADRYRLNPILSSPEDKMILTGEPITISWQTWYNFRAKLKMNGSYVLYHDGQQIDTGDVVFNQFWRPTNLTFDFSSLEPGEHNLTLVVSDEGGHAINETVKITVIPTLVYREGPSQIELGQPNGIIQWTGVTISPLTGELYDNNTLLEPFVWDGSKIELDLNSLTPGKHNISFQIFDESEEFCYNDTFWVTIYSLAPPRIISFPLDQTITFDNYSILSWEIFDVSPKNWTLLIDNTLYQFGNWNQPYFQIEWIRPVLEEAVYNITLILTDQLGYQKTITTWLTIIPPEQSIIIINTPLNTIQWGQKNTSLVWEVYGGTMWTLWKNNTLIRSGEVLGNYIEVLIEEWQYEDWRFGTYNLTLHVTNNEGDSATSSIWILVEISLGDAYANSVVSRSGFTYLSNNALGPPDNIFSTVSVGYAYGYITLDMGINEEIIDGDGPDFEVIAQGGEYNVKVGNSLSHSFSLLGQGTGNQTFDLGAADFSSARYVRIECQVEDSVYLDAIVALNSNSIENDIESPHIASLMWFWLNQTSVTLKWEVRDLTPWNYTILINHLLIKSSPWNGSDIIFTFNLPIISEIQVTLILYDIFGNNANDSVIIEIRDTLTTTSTSRSTKAYYSIIGLLLGLGIMITRRKRRKHDH